MIALAWRLARRELRAGLAGFRIFFACLALGVAAIAGVQSLSDAILTGLAEQGRTLLGGDILVGLVHRPAGQAERAYLNARGAVLPSEVEAVRRAGYSDAEIVEIVTHVGLNTLTNYINEVLDTEIDFPLTGQLLR